MWMHILGGVLIADIKGESAPAFENANCYLGGKSTLQLFLRWANNATLEMHLPKLNQLFHCIEERCIGCRTIWKQKVFSTGEMAASLAASLALTVLTLQWKSAMLSLISAERALHSCILFDFEGRLNLIKFDEIWSNLIKFDRIWSN